MRLITGDNYQGRMIGFNLSSSAPVSVQIHHVEPRQERSIDKVSS